MSKRNVMKIGSKQYYVMRDSTGRFIDITDVGKSIQKDSKDRLKKATKLGRDRNENLKK